MLFNLNNDNKSQIKYFIYCYSDSETSQSASVSLSVQENRLIEYAEIHEFNVVGIYKETLLDDGHTPVFSGILQRILKKEANGLLVWNINHIPRIKNYYFKLIRMIEQNLIVDFSNAENPKGDCYE